MSKAEDVLGVYRHAVVDEIGVYRSTIGEDVDALRKIETEALQQLKADLLGMIETVERVNESNGRYNACTELRTLVEAYFSHG